MSGKSQPWKRARFELRRVVRDWPRTYDKPEAFPRGVTPRAPHLENPEKYDPTSTSKRQEKKLAAIARRQKALGLVVDTADELPELKEEGGRQKYSKLVSWAQQNQDVLVPELPDWLSRTPAGTRLKGREGPLMKHMLRLGTENGYRNFHEHYVAVGGDAIRNIVKHSKNCPPEHKSRILQTVSMYDQAKLGLDFTKDGYEPYYPQPPKHVLVTQEMAQIITYISDEIVPSCALAAYPTYLRTSSRSIPVAKWMHAHVPKWSKPTSDTDEDPIVRVLVINKISDPGNMGMMMRTAAAYGWDAVFVLGTSCEPLGPRAMYTAAGAPMLIPWRKSSWDDIRTWLDGESATNLAKSQSWWDPNVDFRLFVTDPSVGHPSSKTMPDATATTAAGSESVPEAAKVVVDGALPAQEVATATNEDEGHVVEASAESNTEPTTKTTAESNATTKTDNAAADAPSSSSSSDSAPDRAPTRRSAAWQQRRRPKVHLLVLNNESHGHKVNPITNEFLASRAEYAGAPMARPVLESLNVAVAASLLMWHLGPKGSARTGVPTRDGDLVVRAPQAKRGKAEKKVHVGTTVTEAVQAETRTEPPSGSNAPVTAEPAAAAPASASAPASGSAST
ncbi:hypothetical protein AMAG_13873 [Allomyces macrogynus ATCC 38327]|uniref:tRNA/rRNA methyltransferase SpoU type domain-containing protein n=1 Tax=Allomyces macrogynus (strain ATCC 38327) TaxID=578462 RepID=A0A0L0T2E6_ALLM3|nr:hypothetical protein AMAG_13873 [Allomyces macrogynus ATCC 38327]|eukprot:KNE68998.1 hypothetical protein AMAG_13873 [Allomyces macrogynus ATCC 38327]